MAKPKYEDPKQTKKGRRTRLRILVIVVILIGGLIGLMNASWLQIKDIQITGAQGLDKGIFEQATRDYLSNRIAYIIPGTNTITFQSDDYIKKMSHLFPKLKHIKVNMRQGKVLLVEVEERQSTYLWCNEAETCYFVDQDAFVFTEAPEFSDGVYLKLYGGLPALEQDPIGSNYLSEAEFRRIINTTKDLKNQGIVVTRFTIDDQGRYVLNLESFTDIKIPSRTRVIIGREFDALEIIEYMSLLSKVEEFKTKLETIPGQLQYIDLRFPQKIVYKFADEK